MVNLTTADISDSAGAQHILDAIRNRWPWVKHLFADRAYDRRKLMDKAAFKEFVVEIVRRIDADPGFKVLPRRWVVERTFGWMTRWRRLVRDYEKRIDVSKAMIHVAMGGLLLRRIAHRKQFSNGLLGILFGLILFPDVAKYAWSTIQSTLSLIPNIISQFANLRVTSACEYPGTEVTCASELVVRLQSLLFNVANQLLSASKSFVLSIVVFPFILDCGGNIDKRNFIYRQ